MVGTRLSIGLEHAEAGRGQEGEGANLLKLGTRFQPQATKCDGALRIAVEAFDPIVAASRSIGEKLVDDDGRADSECRRLVRRAKGGFGELPSGVGADASDGEAFDLEAIGTASARCPCGSMSRTVSPVRLRPKPV